MSKNLIMLLKDIEDIVFAFMELTLGIRYGMNKDMEWQMPNYGPDHEFWWLSGGWRNCPEPGCSKGALWRSWDLY